MKRFLEMRGGDVGGRDHILAFSAFFAGLVYDSTALDAAWDLVRGWSSGDRQRLRDDVPRLALDASVAGYGLRDIAREALAISRLGLKNRARHDARGRDEGLYLALLDERVARGRVQAQDWLELFESSWNRSVDPLFAKAIY
jgi:glutamate--cysteine ligase